MAHAIRDFKSGHHHEVAFQKLLQRYNGQVFRFFRRKGLASEDCKDLTQEVFFSVYKGLARLQEESRFEGWLYSIAMKTYVTHVRGFTAQKRRARTGPLDVTSGSPPVRTNAANPEEALLEKEKIEQLRAALQALPEQMRHCVCLRLDEVPIQDIALVLRISPNTVKAHLHQAKRVLRRHLSDYFSGPVDGLGSEDLS